MTRYYGITLLYCIAATSVALDIPWNPAPKTSSSPRWLFVMSMETVERNSSEPLMEWDLISHMVISPEQCGFIANVVQMLDDALHRANPEVKNISSTALRLGNNDCTKNETCKCEETQDTKQRRVLVPHRLLEVRTRSSSPSLMPPLQFPLRVTSLKSRKSERSLFRHH